MALIIKKKVDPADLDSSAKGDIMVNTGTDLLGLPVGVDGQIIEADSAEVSGLKWVDIDDTISAVTGTYTPTANLANTYTYDTAAFDGIINAIATLNGGESWSNPHDSGRISVQKTGSGATAAEECVDQNTGTGLEVNVNGSSNPTNYIEVNFLSNSVEIDDVVVWAEDNGTASIRVDYNIGAGWVNAGAQSSNFPVGPLHFAMPMTLINPQLRVYGASAGTSGQDVRDIEVWGNVSVVGTPVNYNLIPDFNTKYIEFDTAPNEVVQIDLDTNSNIGDSFFTVLHCNNSGTLTLNPINGAVILGELICNDGETLILCKAGTDKFLSVKSNSILTAKGNLLTSDGTNEVQLPVGANGTVLTANSGQSTGFEYVNVNTLVDNPFTGAAVTATGTVTLTSASAHYQYIDPDSVNRDVILPDPPTANDFVYIVNSTGNADLLIKETAAGGVEATLTSLVPAAQCHYVGGVWNILTLST